MGPAGAWTHPELNGRKKQFAGTSDIWVHATGQSYYMQLGGWAGLVTYPGPKCTCKDAADPCIHIEVAEALRRPRLPPSKVTDRYWLQVDAPIHDVTPRVGKWLLELDENDLDDAWAKILVSLWQNRLGPSVKARTAAPHPWRNRPGTVICVYTKDSNDEADKQRVLAELHRLGFTQNMRYKTDEETRRGDSCE